MKPAAGYEFNGFVVPEHIADGLEAWANQQWVPGGFLCAVFANDLSEAIGRADAQNLRNLPAIVAWLYNEAPSPCWGSREKFEAWGAEIVTKQRAAP